MFKVRPRQLNIRGLCFRQDCLEKLREIYKIGKYQFLKQSHQNLLNDHRIQFIQHLQLIPKLLFGLKDDLRKEIIYCNQALLFNKICIILQFQRQAGKILLYQLLFKIYQDQKQPLKHPKSCLTQIFCFPQQQRQFLNVKKRRGLQQNACKVIFLLNLNSSEEHKFTKDAIECANECISYPPLELNAYDYKHTYNIFMCLFKILFLLCRKRKVKNFKYQYRINQFLISYVKIIFFVLFN